MKKLKLSFGGEEIICTQCDEPTLTNFKSPGYKGQFPCGFIGRISSIEEGEEDSALVFESAFEFEGKKHDVRVGCKKPLNEWMEVGARCEVMFDPYSVRIVTRASELLDQDKA